MSYDQDDIFIEGLNPKLPDLEEEIAKMSQQNNEVEDDFDTVDEIEVDGIEDEEENYLF
ncbi:MAG: hypothetical protein GTO02_22390 [Candidatus Dadabacteria bacterium]|nr:hypothetical protein [Candidatus Dadabacteria bacterium]